MALIYPEAANALSYVPKNATIILCDQSGIHRAAKSRTEDMGMQLDSLLQGGLVVGELCDYVAQWLDICDYLQNRKVLYLDSFAASAYPEACPPQVLLPMTAKQLPGYGGSMDTAAGDLQHSQKMEFSCLVLCGSRRRAELG